MLCLEKFTLVWEGCSKKIEHGNEQEYGKKLAHLLTQQLTIHWGEGVEIKYAANKNQNKSTQKDPKTEMVCNDATRNEHVLDQKTNIKSGEECFFPLLAVARCLLLLLPEGG